VGVEHGKEGTGEGVGGDVDFGLAIGGAEGHAVGDGPEWILSRGLEEDGMRDGGGFEGDDLALITCCTTLTSELSGVCADVKDEVDLEVGEEETVAESLGGVDIGLSNLVTGSFYYRAEGALQGLCHVVEVSRIGVAGARQRAGSSGLLIKCRSDAVGECMKWLTRAI
jgi:hypothetical protein